MISEFEKALDFDSDTFEDMKRDMNFILQRLIGTMQEKGAVEGSMTLKIDVSMVKEYILNYDPDIKGETREVSKPQFKHKVTSGVKINEDKSGTFNNEMELVMDEDRPEIGEGLPDITEELLGEDGEKPQDDDYGYDDPENNPEE